MGVARHHRLLRRLRREHPLLGPPRHLDGPLGNVLQGIDVAWLVGLLVSGPTYYVLSRSLDVDAEMDEVRASEQELEGDPAGAPSV